MPATPLEPGSRVAEHLDLGTCEPELLAEHELVSASLRGGYATAGCRSFDLRAARKEHEA